MWFQTTRLLPADEVKISARELRVRREQAELAQREADVRAFAMGEVELDLDDYADPNARFVDAEAVIHHLKHDFASRNLLGFVARNYTVDVLEFVGAGSAVVSVSRLVREAGEHFGADRIVWTMTWTRDSGRWTIVNSQASRARPKPMK